MNRDEIIRMAREAGLSGVTVWNEDANAEVLSPDLQDFAALVAAAEREACAKVAEIVGQDKNHWGIAAAIRARGNP